MDKKFINRVVNDMVNDTKVWFEFNSYANPPTVGCTYYSHPYLTYYPLSELSKAWRGMEKNEGVYSLFSFKYDFSLSKPTLHHEAKISLFMNYLSHVYGVLERDELECIFIKYRKRISDIQETKRTVVNGKCYTTQ